jgi:hypothetical protein
MRPTNLCLSFLQSKVFQRSEPWNAPKWILTHEEIWMWAGMIKQLNFYGTWPSRSVFIISKPPSAFLLELQLNCKTAKMDLTRLGNDPNRNRSRPADRIVSSADRTVGLIHTIRPERNHETIRGKLWYDPNTNSENWILIRYDPTHRMIR